MAKSERAIFGLVLAALLALLGANMGLAQLDLGRLKPALILAIAVSMATLVIWFFMGVRRATMLTRLFACAGFFWLLILFGLSLSDYLTRGGLPIE
jgi:cytochrome c oxidase subunit 4